MPASNKSRAWFFPTSPRSPYKLQGELKLLKQLEGKVWNSETQIEFAKLLQASKDFDGNISLTDPAFSARDRATRAPRLLGFVHFPKRASGGKLRFTAVGNALINASKEEQVLIFQRQLAKVQFFSPLHKSGGFDEMAVRPLMVMIKLLLKLETMSKEEVALFATTLTDPRDFPKRLKAVHEYRKKLKELSARERKIYRKDFSLDWVADIYSEDIKAGNTRLREGGNDFLKTKYQTLRDYADSTIRYLRATGLFTVNPHGQRLTLLNASIEDAKFLLENYGIGISDKSHLEYDDYIEQYLGNPSIPEIRKDDPVRQAEDISRMLEKLSAYDSKNADELSRNYKRASSKLEKLQAVGQMEQQLGLFQVKNEAKTIRQDFSASLANIKATYQEIAARQSEILDKPLMYEWNTWRAMILINDAVNVQGNFVTDPDGNPVTTAGGGKPDIMVEYASFWLNVEVTLSSGQRQYEMEGEPISRHLGDLQKERADNGDTRPVFGLFVAETIPETVIGHLITLARYKNQRAKGPIRIIPMRRELFELFMESALRHPTFSHQVLRNFFEGVFSRKALSMGELDWMNYIEIGVCQGSWLLAT
jgi:hypothetical protein